MCYMYNAFTCIYVPTCKCTCTILQWIVIVIFIRMKQCGEVHVTVWLQVFDVVFANQFWALSPLAQILPQSYPASVVGPLPQHRDSMAEDWDLGGVCHLNPPELGLTGIILHVLCHLQQHLQGGSSDLFQQRLKIQELRSSTVWKSTRVDFGQQINGLD